MPPFVEVRGVTLDYHVYSVRAQSLRNSVFNLAVGGRLFKSSGDVTVIRALSNVNFTLKDGDRVALMGHNGSGKTTMLKVLSGIYEPTQGSVKTNGKITSMISFGAGLDMEATGLQNIRKIGLMYQQSRKQIDTRTPSIVEFSELGDFVRLPLKTYSAGMLARLMFSIATEFDAEVLILDEWLSAGDASFMHKAGQRMKTMVDRARIVVLATHDPSLAHSVCNKACVMEAGQVRFFGDMSEWMAMNNVPAVA